MKRAEKERSIFMEVFNDTISNKDRYIIDPEKNFTRNRALTLENTAEAIYTMSGSSLNKELREYFKGKAISATASAFVQQRAKIKPELFSDVFSRYNALSQAQGSDKKTFLGYNVYAVDGSAINLPRDPKECTYIINNGHAEGINQLHLNALYDVCNKTYADCIIQPQSVMDEQDGLIAMLGRTEFKKKSIVLMDRGYEGFNNFAHLIDKKNTDFICRVKNCNGSAIKEIKALPQVELDTDIEVVLTDKQTKEAKNKGHHYVCTGNKKGNTPSPKTNIQRFDYPFPYVLKLRVVRIMLDSGTLETIVTTLDRNTFTPNIIKKLYHLRWGIETSFRELKYIMGVTNLHSKKLDSIEQEIYAALTVYNLCQRIISEISVYNGRRRAYRYQINYTIAVTICKEFFRTKSLNGDAIEAEITKYILPVRPGRSDKRKLRPKGFVGFIYRVAA